MEQDIKSELLYLVENNEKILIEVSSLMSQILENKLVAEGDTEKLIHINELISRAKINNERRTILYNQLNNDGLRQKI